MFTRPISSSSPTSAYTTEDGRLEAKPRTWSKVVVFLGSTRDIRLGDRVAKFINRKLQEKQLSVEFVGEIRCARFTSETVKFGGTAHGRKQNFLNLEKKNTNLEEAMSLVPKLFVTMNPF